MPISPNMGLNVPVVSTTPGPQYAQNVNASLSKIDTHNHTSGQGVQVPTAGLNINSNLPMNSFGLTNASIVNFVSSLLPANNGTLYRNTNDLYFKDGAGNNVRITLNGSVNVSGAVGFTGLPFGTASASYNNSNQTFVFESATNTAANVDCGSVTLREVVAGAKGVTLSSPLALANDYTMRMPPALPINTEALLVSSTGSITAGGTANSLTATTVTGTNVNVLNALAIKNNSGILQFRDAADAVQFCAITGSSSGLSLNLPDTADSYTFNVNGVPKAVIDNSGIDAQYLYGTPPINLGANVLATSVSATGSTPTRSPGTHQDTMTTFTITTTKANAVIMGEFLTGNVGRNDANSYVRYIEIYVAGTNTGWLNINPMAGVFLGSTYSGFTVSSFGQSLSNSMLIPVAGTYTVSLRLGWGVLASNSSAGWNNITARIVQIN